MCILLSCFFFIGCCYHVIITFCYKTSDLEKRKKVKLAIYLFFIINNNTY